MRLFDAASRLDRLPSAPHVTAVIGKLRENRFQAYIVGGTIRDALLARPPRDWDLATDATLDRIASLFPRVVKTGWRYGTLTVWVEDTPIQVSTFRAAGIREDLGHRDFTVNAMAYEPGGDMLIDPFDGLHDLLAGRIRAVEDPGARFREDPLRLIRAIRLAVELGFSIERDTRRHMGQSADLLGRVAVERIRDELRKMLLGPAPARAFAWMRQTRILRQILPELESPCMRRALQVLAQLPPRESLRWAALLLSLGQSVLQSARAGREGLGALAREVLTRIRIGKRERERVIHLLLGLQEILSLGGTDPEIRGFLLDFGEANLEDLFCLLSAIRLTGAAPSTLLERTDSVRIKMASILFECGRDGLRPAVTGKDVMRVLGIPPGPMVGEVLRAARERVIHDPSCNRRPILEAWVRRQFADHAGEGRHCRS